MKKIGRGWQYTTYDLGNGRVLKKYNSKLVGYWHMCKECFPFQNDKPWKFPKYYQGCRETALDSVKKLAQPVLEAWMMGNPKILNDLDYEQDKLLPLHDFLSTASDEEGKRAIDDFVEFNKMLIQKSLIDKSFNIAKNFAFDQQGRIILMDLGELYSSNNGINKQIKNRAWAESYVVNQLPPNLRTHFVEKMDSSIRERSER
jgi:hypothetical protein